MDTMLFVYGTLKRGLRNHVLLAGQQFEGVARTLPHYRLVDRGPYPCMVEDQQRGVAVQGEIWRVDGDTLARLDELEDVPRLFARRQVDVAGMSAPVFAYLYQGDVAGMKDCGDRWPQFP
jgi:gamma-glutamylaminecyclotransferase